MHAAHLRRRQAKLSTSLARNNLPPPRRPTFSPAGRRWTLLSALLIFAVLLAQHRKRGGLPDVYGICSAEGRVWTVAEGEGRVECVVVGGKEIVGLGGRDEIDAQWPNLHIRPLHPGAALYPGFVDAHAHVLAYGKAQSLSLEGCSSVSEVVDRLRTYILADPSLTSDRTRWIEGAGWDQTRFTPPAFPTADELASDPLLAGRPIVLTRIDVHASWVSPRALEIAGSLPETVEGGLIVRDESGQATGVLVDNAMELVSRHIPPTTDAQRLAYLQRTTQDMLERGLVGVHDAAATPEDLRFFKKAAGEGHLPIKLYAMVDCGMRFCRDEVERLDGYADGHLTVRAAKIFTDGALGSWGAALHEPYSDKPDTRGILKAPEEAFGPLVQQWVDAGFQVNAHGIGDKANTVVLDAFAAALRSIGDPPGANTPRLRVEHAQILTPQDVERLGELGVIASVQPTHATSDMWYAEERLGPERIKGAYAWRTLLKNSVRLPLGTDFPVERIGLLETFHASITRLSPSSTSPHGPSGWYPAQRLTHAEALRGLTLEPAYAAFAENVTGSLRVGKRADFTVLERDVMEVEEEEVLDVKVRATVVDGRVVWGAL